MASLAQTDSNQGRPSERNANLDQMPQNLIIHELMDVAVHLIVAHIHLIEQTRSSNQTVNIDAPVKLLLKH
jgi:hypothetical protein